MAGPPSPWAGSIDAVWGELRDATGDGLAAKLLALAAHVPCGGHGPAAIGARRKWAVEGLRKFYQWFPFRNEDGSWVRRLAPYQEDIWADRWENVGDNGPKDLARVRYVVKSQKVGLSFTHILEDIHVALSPRGWGREIIIAAQNQVKAEEHLKNLKDLIRRSPFAPFLIERMPRTRYGRIMRDALSRSNVAALFNPADPDGRPTRIWAVGITSHSLLLSNVAVEHIHLSDVTVADSTPRELDRSIAQIRSRIVKSRGTMVVETPPGGPTGHVYAQYREACRSVAAASGWDRPLDRLPPGERALTEWGLFRRVPWRLAVDQGVLTRDTVERDRHDINNEHEFARLYEADFQAGAMVAYPNAVRRRSTEAAGILNACMDRTPGGI